MSNVSLQYKEDVTTSVYAYDDYHVVRFCAVEGISNSSVIKRFTEFRFSKTKLGYTVYTLYSMIKKYVHARVSEANHANRSRE